MKAGNCKRFSGNYGKDENTKTFSPTIYSICCNTGAYALLDKSTPMFVYILHGLLKQELLNELEIHS